MFKVETYLAESTGKGLGVFAKNPIEKGTIIWEFVEGFDICVHESELERLNPVQKAFVEKYFWKEGSYWYSSCDNASFQNHSSQPNSVGNGNNQMIAVRDIFAGEEILVNYSQFDDDYESYGKELIQ